MLEAVAERFRKAAGIRDVADFGCLHDGQVGRNRCEIFAGIEVWKGTYFFRIKVRHSRGRGFRKTAVIKWAYDPSDPFRLDAVIRDLRAVEGALHGTGLVDRRTAFGRLFDRLTRRGYIGAYRFVSPLREAKSEVRAELCRVSGGAPTVFLTESRRHYGFTMSELPHEAFAKIRAAVEAYAAARPPA